ncbi:potassium channel family protein [Paenibacillus thermotolerans]|uniref:potassium channel family protein n=1 Tax=Paenibacillus thermotolerans TaxID=3027807 RepID=UPI00236758D0|nr:MULTISPECIES: TrkA family potassium uptake protein [unclassified Paenibacillus]
MKMKQFAVIGLGRFGSSVALTLMKEGYEVLGVDKDEEIINHMADSLTHAVVADTTDEEVMQSIGIRNFDCVVVAIGDDIQASIMTALLLKEIGVKMVVAKALSQTHGKVLEKIGVDKVIFPERDMGERVANQLISPNLLDYIDLSNDVSIAEMAAPKRLTGRTLKELDLRAKYGCSVVAIIKKNGVIVAPTADDVIEEGDMLVLIGTNGQIEHFENKEVY